MKKSLILLIFIVAIVLSAAATCPDRAKHVDAIVNEVLKYNKIKYKHELNDIKTVAETVHIDSYFVFNVSKNPNNDILSIGLFGNIIHLCDYHWSDKGITTYSNRAGDVIYTIVHMFD